MTEIKWIKKEFFYILSSSNSTMDESKYITIEEAVKKGSGSVKLRGWVYRQRKSNKFVFLNLRDESDIRWEFRG
ncbi:MAG: hypothetical protein GY870_07425 [archaeon]|nr:hypothetical protein [archaeon]